MINIVPFGRWSTAIVTVLLSYDNELFNRQLPDQPALLRGVSVPGDYHVSSSNSFRLKSLVNHHSVCVDSTHCLPFPCWVWTTNTFTVPDFLRSPRLSVLSLISVLFLYVLIRHWLTPTGDC